MSDFINTVDVLGDKEVVNAILSRTIEEFRDDQVTSIATSVFRACTKLTTVDLPNVTSISTYGFYDCTALRSINIPSVSSVLGSSFYQCTSLEELFLPYVTTLQTFTIAQCHNLKKVDFPLVTSIDSYVFYYCCSLTTVILRSTTMCTLSSTSPFAGCHHYLGSTHETYNPNGDKDGYIYVPRSLVDTYKADSVWSKYATQFRAIEDYPNICG